MLDGYPLTTDFSPATLQQLIALLTDKLLQEQLPEIGGMIRLTGRLPDPGQARGSMHYGVKISDDGGAAVKTDIPASLLTSRRCRTGNLVRVTGRLQTKMTNYGLEVRLVAGDIEPVNEGGEKAVREDVGAMNLQRLKGLPVRRHAFPNKEILAVALIQSSSVEAQVTRDCRAELEKLGDRLNILPQPINILDPVAISRAIDNARCDILIIIRGGGDKADFEVFDDPRVVESLAKADCYRVVGLGHSGNATLLDHIAEYAARTPAQAGLHVREVIEGRLRFMASLQDRLQTEAKARMASEKKALFLEEKLRTMRPAQEESRTTNIPIWWAAVAAGIALFVGMIIARW